MSGIDLPVLLLGFNRPKETRRVIDALRLQKPRQIFFAVDGPRLHKAGEADLQAAVCDLAIEFDWHCKVQTLFREQNLGCGRAVSTAINWFFEHVERGVILEDDCLPSPEFLPFCSEMLAKYQTVERVAHISGNNFQLGQIRAGGASYYGSFYPHIWGWATWRRAWQAYAFNLPSMVEIEALPKSILNALPMKMVGQVAAGLLDTWDVQWLYHCVTQDKICITPNTNLVRNIGFEQATHTFEAPFYMNRMRFDPLGTIIHPQNLERDVAADECTNALLYNLSLPNLAADKWHKGLGTLRRLNK
jgi:hypothetical protein